MRRLPAYGGTKTRHNATFKQRYEEAERRRAAIVMQRLAGLNKKPARIPDIGGRRPCSIKPSARPPSPSGSRRCRRRSG